MAKEKTMTRPNPKRVSAHRRRPDTSEFDVDASGTTREPRFLTPPESEKKRHDRVLARAKRGRPKVGAGAKRIQVTVERTLLREADARARKDRVTRAELIARALRLALAS
jgi:hypothetical protein